MSFLINMGRSIVNISIEKTLNYNNACEPLGKWIIKLTRTIHDGNNMYSQINYILCKSKHVYEVLFILNHLNLYSVKEKKRIKKVRDTQPKIFRVHVMHETNICVYK
jgi:hypothetical protein